MVEVSGVSPLREEEGLASISIVPVHDSSESVSMTTEPDGSWFNLIAIGLLFRGSVVSTKSKQSNNKFSK